MDKLTLSKGFTPKLAGAPDLTVIRLPFPRTIGLPACDIPFIRPKLLVKEGEMVKTGTPLFTDKRDPSITYVSPATGRVKQIIFGPRRRLLEVVISAQAADEFMDFGALTPDQIKEMPKEALVEHLKKGGLWQGLRQFPALDTADPDHLPAMIIVSLNGNDIFSPHPALVLKDKLDHFFSGLELLSRFSHRVVVTARESSLSLLEALPGVAERITHVTDDTYPAWNPGAVLYQVKQSPADNTAWSVSLDHLIMMGQFLSTGRYPVERMVTLTQDGDRRPHMIIRQGAPVSRLAGHVTDGSLVTTGQFNGRQMSSDSHIGFFETTVNIIGPGEGEEMFGFVRPGLDKTTVSASFLSSLFKERPARVDCTLHGEERACINCSYCQRICPNEMMPSFIMKALHADEIEEALSMGLLDCCQCGLCSFTCPSKIELARVLKAGMDAHHKDKS